jgi:hypothetical protein
MNADILTLAHSLGARLKRQAPSSPEFEGPCPRCGGKDRFSVNIRKGVWNCRFCGKGGDSIDLLRHMRGLSFIEAKRLIEGELPKRVERVAAGASSVSEQTNVVPYGKTTTAMAMRDWGEGVDPPGTPVEAHLASRKLRLPEEICGNVLRWHPRKRALLALFRNIVTNDPQAVMRMFFDAEGRLRVHVDPETGKKTKRWFLGPVAGAAVKLDVDEAVRGCGVLHIGEGVETCMAARQIGLKPCWALGSAGAIAKFQLLDGVNALLILREHCEANQSAAEECAERWFDGGREVFDVWPNRGKDVNDAIKGGAT